MVENWNIGKREEMKNRVEFKEKLSLKHKFNNHNQSKQSAEDCTDEVKTNVS